jgi:exopolysaccharide production repressor protein
MSFPLFLRGLVLVLAAFAITTYAITGSFWSTLIQTVICAVLVQIGYFAAVLFLVYRSDRTKKSEASAAQAEATQSLAKESQPASEVGRLPGAPSSHRS